MGKGQGACSKWWTLRTNLEKTFISLSIILLSTVIILILVGVGFHSKSLARGKISEECMSTNCIEKAGSMIEMSNFDVGYCDDFYEFACGRLKDKPAPIMVGNSDTVTVENLAANKVLLKLKNWLESPKDNSNVTSFKKAKTFYKTCMDFNKPLDVSLSVLHDVIKAEGIGPWPILNSVWNESEKLEIKLASLLKIGVPVGFHLNVVPDSNHSGQYIARITPGLPTFPMFDVNQVRDDPMLRSYIGSLLLLLGVKQHTISADVNEIVSMEVSFLRNKKIADEECGNQVEAYRDDLITTRITLKQLAVQIYEMNFTLLMSHVFTNYKGPDLENVIVELYCRRHVRDYASILATTEARTVHNYLAWRFLSHFAQHLGEPFASLHLVFQNRAFLGNQPELLHSVHWIHCISVVEKYMLPVLGAVYKDKELNNAILEEKKSIASDVRNSLTSMISTSKYIKSDKKNQLKQKISLSKFDIPVLKVSTNNTKIDKWFSQLSLQHDHLMHNVMRSQKFIFMKSLQLLTQPNEEQLQWEGMSITSVGKLKYRENTIAINFDKLLPQYLKIGSNSRNYGAFGTTISKDLLLYLINTSSIVVAEGNHSFWNVFDSTIDQNACFVEESPEMNYDAEEMTVSNLMELSALTTSFNSYNDRRGKYQRLPGMNFTEDQMFFLVYAQTQCEVSSPMRGNVAGSTAQTRINFALKNFGKFNEAYNCEKKKPMNPNEKCQLWIS